MLNDLPDAPYIRNCERTGYPDGRDPESPYYPVCGAECSFIYKYEYTEIVGCDVCLTASAASETPECYLA